MEKWLYESGTVSTSPEGSEEINYASGIPKLAVDKKKVIECVMDETADLQPFFIEVIPKHITVPSYFDENDQWIQGALEYTKSPPKYAIYINAYNKKGELITPYIYHKEDKLYYPTLSYLFTIPANRPLELYRNGISYDPMYPKTDPFNARCIKGKIIGKHSVKVQVDKFNSNLTEAERLSRQGKNELCTYFTVNIIEYVPSFNTLALKFSSNKNIRLNTSKDTSTLTLKVGEECKVAIYKTFTYKSYNPEDHSESGKTEYIIPNTTEYGLIQDSTSSKISLEYINKSNEIKIKGIKTSDKDCELYFYAGSMKNKIFVRVEK